MSNNEHNCRSNKPTMCGEGIDEFEVFVLFVDYCIGRVFV